MHTVRQLQRKRSPGRPNKMRQNPAGIRRPLYRSNHLWHGLATSISLQTEAQDRGGDRSADRHSHGGLGNDVLRTLASPGGGEPLPDSIRSRLEPVLGADLEQVRLHGGTTAQNAALALNARAFTHENHIFLGQGQSKSDTRLLAHELTHVVQQRGAGSSASGAEWIQCDFACPATLGGEIIGLRTRLEEMAPESSPEREDLQAQLTWREQLAAQCGQLTGYTSTRADSLAYLQAEAMLHRGRIADASRELARMEPASSASRLSLDNERDHHREALLDVLERRSVLLEEEIAELRQLLLSGITGEESPERELLIRYEDQWVAHQNEMRPLRRWQARRRINAIQGEVQEIESWLQILPQVCSRDYPQAEELLNRQTALLEEQQRLVDFLTGSMVEYEQFDSRWGATRYGTNPSCTTVREAGCGPTSLAIVLNYLYAEDPELAGAGGNIDFVTPPETVRYAETHGRVCNSGTAGDTMVTNVHTGWPGFRGRRISLVEATQFLRTGIPVIFLCRNCTGTTRSGAPSHYGGHYMVLRSVDATGTTYSVLDPGRGERRDIETISARELQRNTAGFWVIERI